MKKLVCAVLLILFASSAGATAYERVLCPPYVGTFSIVESGVLTVTIVKRDDKPVAPRTEQLANPLRGKEAEAMVRRGAVQFNAHVDKDSGRLFIHWDSVKSSR